MPQKFFLSEWRLKAMAAVCDCSVSVCEAVFALSVCGELLLKTALVLVHILAVYLSVLLKLNAFLKVTLAGVIFPRGSSDQTDCSMWISSENSDSCSFLGRKKRAVRWLQTLQAALYVLPAVCQHLLRVSVTVLPVLHAALPVPLALFNNFRPIFSSVLASLDYTGAPSVFHILGILCNRRTNTAFQL